MRPFLSLILIFVYSFAFPQSENESLRSTVPVPPAEMRAAWITSVSNLDWPKPGDRNDIEAQKESLINYYDSLVSLNMNAAFLQVRPECDALYQSSYEPWSRYLTGVQGIDPGYDPMQFAIEEAHKRGLELHAWLNPYRINASTNDGSGYYSPEHVYMEHPEWALTYADGKKILNPGLPEVQLYIKEVVGDIIQKYDVDGIHFDDYFYSYSGTPTSLDQATYEAYGAEYATIGDFRRGSINKMIANVWDTIQSVRSYIRFGVSPFGIYGNGMNPDGITGLDAYNTIYCDPLAWLAEGTVDYITPQLYWPTGGSQDYAKLLPWWADWVNTYNRHLFPGHAIYRLASDAPVARISDTSSSLHELKDYFNQTEPNAKTQADPWTLDQIVRQIEINRQHADLGALGSVYFRMNDFYRVNNLHSYLKEQVYFNKVLFPEMSWKASSAPEPPSALRLEQVDSNSFFSLVWDHPKDSIRYVIYAFNSSQSSGPYTLDENRIAITYNKDFNLSSGEIPYGSSLVVTALDRYGLESAPSAVFNADTPQKVVLFSPEENATNVVSSAKLQWYTAKFASRYKVEIALDNTFTNGLLSVILEDTSIFISQIPLEGETQFFWRVAGENISGAGTFSDTLSFTTGYPSSVTLIKPAHHAQSVELQPEIAWSATTGTDSIQVQISEGGTGFSIWSMVVDTTVVRNEASSFVLNKQLRTLYTHYIRIRGINNFGTTAWTEVSQFKTLLPPPAPPIISSPSNNAVELLIPVTINWNVSAGATSYVLQLSDNVNFSNLLLDKPVYNSNSYELTGLEMGTSYWVRVAARNAGGVGEWSELTKFSTVSPVTDINKIYEDKIYLYPNPGNGNFHIEGLSKTEISKIVVTDIVGREIYSKEVNSSTGSSLIDLQGGQNCNPCLLKVETHNGLYIIKILIKP